MLGPTLSHYRIIRQLGQGGMGEVYLAEDLNLKRQVALKVLPEALRNDPEQLRRFRIEAEAAAKLNHPNIAQIYSIEEADITDVETRHVASLLFITMEYVDGQTLHLHIPHDGLTLDRFFEWFIPLSDALTHAHEHGVTHRDLKPGNIMIRVDGVPKILDFGLARIKRPEPGEVDHDAPTVSMGALKSLTQRGAVLGTPAYMSPEQARGQEVDHRTDLFSFGIVLYQTLTGRCPFDGADYVSIISSILKDEPAPVTTLKPALPRAAGRIIGRCLQKEARNRYHAAADLRNDLKDIQTELATGTLVVAAQPAAPPAAQPAPVSLLPVSLRSRAAIIGAAVLLVALGALAAWFLKPSPEPPLRKFQMPVEFSDNGNFLFAGPAISPDGTMVAYPQGNRLWVRSLSQTEPRELPGTEYAVRPFWSSDSRFVGYFVVGNNGGQAIRTVAVQGGSSVPVCTLPGGWPRGATWNATGDIVFSLTTGDLDNSGGLYTVPSQGGTPRVFLRADSTRGELGLIYPQFLPDGRSLVCAVTMADNAGTLVVVSGDTRTTLVRQPGARLAFPGYAPSGHLVYQRGFPEATGVWAVPINLRSRTKTGDPFLVADKMAIPSVSVDGTLVYRSALSAGGTFQLVWVDRSGKVEGTIGQPQAGMALPALSPDGQRVAVNAVENGNVDIWIHDAVRGTRTRLTFDPAVDDFPAWSPTGDQIAFESYRSGAGDIFLQAADGSSAAQPIVTGPTDAYSPTWSRDGKYLAYNLIDSNTGNNLWYLPLTGERKPVPFLQTPFAEFSPVFSPDGRYVAYTSNESGRNEVYVKPFPRGEGRWSVSVNGGFNSKWSGRGNELFYVEGNTLMAVTVDTRSGFRVGIPQKLFTGESVRATPGAGYDVTADGKRFVVVQTVGEEKATTPVLTVVENWSREFRKAGKSDE